MDENNTESESQHVPLEFTGKPQHDIARTENADPDTEIGSSAIDRLSGESPEEWRAMLLWGMVKTKKRSFRLTAKAMDKSDFWIRKLYKKHTWDSRIKSFGAWGDHNCLKTYCLKSVHVNSHEELAHVDRHCRKSPIAALGKYAPELKAILKPRIVPDEQPSPITRAVAQAINDVEAEVQGVNTVDVRKDLLEEQKKITRAVIGRGVEGLRDGSMKIGPKDLQNFMAMAQELHGFSFDEGTGARGTESVRVKFARDQGEDILVALRKDHRDHATILQQLWDMKQQDSAHKEVMEAERAKMLADLES